MAIRKNKGNLENMSDMWVLSTFSEYSQMSGVFYHSAIHA